MVLKFLFNILVFVFTGTHPGSLNVLGENPDHPVNENSSPGKLTHAATKKDSVSQTQTPFIIFKLINTNHQNPPAKNTGSLKNAGKVARTANDHKFSGKI
jgi:hypothetical protein